MQAGKRSRVQKTAFLYSNLSNLGLNRVRLGACQASNSIFSFFFCEPLKRLRFRKGRQASETERGEVKKNPAQVYKGYIYMTPKDWRSQ